MSQIFASGKGSDKDEVEEAGQIQSPGVSIDDLLDEIDSVLETDAQSFVQGFVQKGGE
ncbi:MAG: ubiquitin-like protein Pup [Actinomycetaceae bacterium]|nr:ubiquitin-like protein Pup [Actinomycetaceae bacterium]